MEDNSHASCLGSRNTLFVNAFWFSTTVLIRDANCLLNPQTFINNHFYKYPHSVAFEQFL